MGIEAGFSLSALDSLLEAVPEILYEEVVRAFSYLGEQCVRRVRDRSGEESWFDQTGALRSSIGYAVYEQGRLLMESAFESVGGQGAEGSAKGRRMVAELASKYAQTYALVVLAGMEYAEYVEAMKNKDVLASTELWARSRVGEYLDKAKERASRRIAALQKQLGL